MHCRVANVGRQVRVANVGRQVLGALSSGKCGKAGLWCIVEWQMWEGRS